MKRISESTKVVPLHVQLCRGDKYKIEELKVTGFIGERDFALLTEMSQEKGKLRVLDLSDITETECEIYSPAADDIYCPVVGIRDDAFVYIHAKQVFIINITLFQFLFVILPT